MDTRRRLLFRATSRILQGAGAEVVVTTLPIIRLSIRLSMGRIRTVTRRRSPRVTAAVEAEEDSPIFPAFQANSPASSVVLGSEKERVLEMGFLNPAPMPRHMHPLSRHTGTDRIGRFRRSPFQSNLRLTHRLTHHPTRQASLTDLEKATNLLTISLSENSGTAVEPGDTVTLEVGLDMAGLRSHSRKRMKRTRIRGRTTDSLDTLRTTTLDLRYSPTLSRGSDSETDTRFRGWRGW